MNPPEKRHRDRGDGTVWWDKINKCYVGSIALDFNSDGSRNRPSVRGRAKTEVKEKLEMLHEEINAASGLRPHTQLSYRTGSDSCPL